MRIRIWERKRESVRESRAPFLAEKKDNPSLSQKKKKDRCMISREKEVSED